IAMFGVMKAGAAYIPCDPQYPTDRIKLITEDSHARFVITTKDRMDNFLGRALDVEELLALSADETTKKNPDIAEDSSSLAYLIYTSGSTGRPKGVMLRHKGICNYLTDHEENRHFHALVTDCRVMLCITTVSFDLSLKEIGSSLFNGMTLVFASEEEVNDPQALALLMERTGVDAFSGTPSRLKMFLDLPAFKEAFSKCKFIVLGGEKYPPTLLPEIKKLAPTARLFNTYGPTEISVSCNGKELTHADHITIGRPLLNVKEYIVDEDMNELPVGVTGELLIGGDGVAAGYNDLPDKTAEAFIDYNQERCYRSGDYAYWTEDGEVVILGRKDHQIKLNGLRIELGEVETVLNRQPQIREGVVMIKNVEGHDHLVAYYTLKEDFVNNYGDTDALHDALKESMGQTLTHYMVPTIFVQLEKMPISPNGKTDLKALPEPVMQLSPDSFTMPQTTNEKSLYDIVAEILGNKNFGTNTNLISVGLTSLLAIRLSVFVNGRMNATLSVNDILRYPSIGELALKLRYKNTEQNTENLSVENAVRPSMSPLSFSQLGIYSECTMNEEDIQYNIPVCIAMPKGVLVSTLDNALRKVIEAHPYINTHFRCDDNGDVYQCPIENFKIDIPQCKLSDEELEEQKKDFVRPFQLESGPLYRLKIVETPSGVYLLADFHHLIMDGASLDMFYKQLCCALDGELLPKEEYDYYQFVQDQKIDPSTETYFEKQLSQVEELSSLLPDKEETEPNHRMAEVKISTNLGDVQRKCKSLNITPASLYLAALTVTLSKYTANDTVSLCTISNGRGNMRISNTFGMFVNTLPFVQVIDSNATVEHYLRQTADSFFEAVANENYPYGRIVEKYGYVGRVMYAYQVGVLSSYQSSFGTLSIEKLELQKAKFPILVFIEGSIDSGALINVQYDESIYSEALVRDFAVSIENVVRCLLSCEKMSEVNLCNEQMISRLDSFNQKSVEISQEDTQSTVLSLFRSAVERSADNVAAVFKDKTYTYRELDEVTNKVAGLIYSKVKNSNQKEPVVSILIPRNEYMFILPIAAMKAGCAYQPLDPSYPKERLSFMVKDSNAALLIADPELHSIVSGYDGEVILTSELEHLETLPLPKDTLTSESLFILLYTSGSTGTPKGVMLEHGNLVAFIKWYWRYYGLTSKDKVAAYASFGFDANMMDLYPALTIGATLHVISEDIRLDLVAINDYFEKNGITHSFLTTQVGVQFLQNTENHSLKHLSVGGEKLVSVTPPLDYTLHNGYGPTECTVFSTILQVSKKEQNIPIGKPLDELECYVMDKHLHRLPVGAIGELIIVGSQVGRGYLNRPDKTAESFFTYNGQRAYHSGDIVRYRQDGNIEFIGRHDGQVKIRGFRIELKEVEAVIREMEDIKDVTVQAFDHPSSGKFIAAYVVSDKAVNVEQLNNFIMERKPAYMVPAVTMQIDRIPLNVNQKVDRKALPKPEIGSRSAMQNHALAAPLNSLEEVLKQIIVSVIGNEEFTITDILGYIGLTSISSIRLAALIYKRFGIRINPSTLIKGTLQSIENDILSVWLVGNTSTSESSVKRDIVSSSKTSTILEAPLTFPQQGVYMDCQMNPESTMYNIPQVLEFPAEVSPHALSRAVKRVVEEHSSLFCNFFQTDQGVVMRCDTNRKFEVPIKNISAQELEKTKQDFMRPFDLEHDILCRAEIYSVEQSSNFLLLDMHHLVADGGSMSIIFRQIIDVLQGKDIEKENCSYLRFATEQNEKAAAGALEKSKAFFDEMFSTYESAANVPADKTSAQEGLPQHAFTPITEYLLNLKLPAGVTQAHFWFAVFNYTLSRFANTKDVYTAFISGGRQNLDIVDTVGMFVNTLPCAVHIKDQSVEEYLSEVSSAFFDCIEHENYPFARIAADYDFKGCASFAYQMGLHNVYTIAEKKIVRSSISLSKAKIPFSIFIMNNDGVPSVDAEYDDSMYSRELALHFTESMVAVAEHFASDFGSQLKFVSIMSERQKLEVEHMHSVNEDMSFTIRTFHEGIERWAEKTPDAVALMACDRNMTYREYNAEANRLARALISRGLVKADRVVLLLPRRSYYLTAMFAVMKCGGAFIPMDPDYPADRIEYILNDSEGRFV
ncbi:MAG: amino acid adenylation domain-containing protein, partial [Alistipes sp.]|nr:amino acid adenylation domain-containing protein [Candidatus Alistipes equi]